MKRFAMIVVLPLLAMGCSEEPAAPATTAKPVASTPAPTTPTTATPAVAAAKPAAPAPKAYFESKQDGTTYVFGSFASLQKFKNGATDLKWTKKDGPNGEAVALEADDGQLSDSLWGEYSKSHPKKVAP